MLVPLTIRSHSRAFATMQRFHVGIAALCWVVALTEEAGFDDSFALRQQQMDVCMMALHRNLKTFRELSAVMSKDHNWDILRRHGEPSVCMHEGHRFFFALFFYSHKQTASGSSDFAACVPRECDEAMAADEVLPEMYSYFFDEHAERHEDGSYNREDSMQYSLTVKEYKSGIDASAGLEVFIGAALILLPGLFITFFWELPWTIYKHFQPTRSEAGGRLPLVLDAFSLRRGWESLSTAADASADLCWLRLGLVASLITLHVTQGSKWRYIEALEAKHIVFTAVRPLALVNDAFVQLSTYLCAWSHAKVEASWAAPVNTGGTISISKQLPLFPQRLGIGLARSMRKYLRQVSPCLLWNWFYLFLLPAVRFNPYNHAFPWFGIRWYQATGKCMQHKLRYSLLLGDVGALLFQDGDQHWWAGNGNPCVNLWNFQLEIQAFTLATCVLALPSLAARSVFVAILACGFNAGAKSGFWFVHHARGVAMQLLFLSCLGLPHASPPPKAWRKARGLGLLVVFMAVCVHGVSRGKWLSESWPEIWRAVKARDLLATGLWQAALAIGMALLGEGCRAQAQQPDEKSSQSNGSHSSSSMSSSATQPGPWLAAANRLAFGVNLAHPFIQFYVEAHTSLSDRVFSLFSWPIQLFLITAMSTLAAVVGFLFVQRPWAILLCHGFDTMLDLLRRLMGTRSK